MGKRKEGPPGEPPEGCTVKLKKDFFEGVWWVGEVERRGMGEILEEIARATIMKRFKAYEKTVAQLKKSAVEQAQIMADARRKLAGSQ